VCDRATSAFDKCISINVVTFKSPSTKNPSEPCARVADQSALQFEYSMPSNEQSCIQRTSTASTRSVDLPYYKSALLSIAYACVADSTVGFPSHISLYEIAVSFGSLPRIFVL